jgi:hypothetical protein
MAGIRHQFERLVPVRGRENLVVALATHDAHEHLARSRLILDD